MNWFGLWHINLRGLFNTKEEQQKYYLAHSWEYKRYHTFPKIISLKVNLITQLKFELIDSDVAV